MKNEKVSSPDHTTGERPQPGLLNRSIERASPSIKDLSSKPNRTAIALVTALGLTLASCALFGPSDSEIYSLQHVDGQALPATIISATTVNGDLYEFQVVRASLTLLDFGRLKRERDVRNAWNGVPSDTVNAARFFGTYQRTDTTLTIRFTDRQGLLLEYTYRILEGGRVLRGIEGDFAPRLYEYVRQ